MSTSKTTPSKVMRTNKTAVKAKVTSVPPGKTAPPETAAPETPATSTGLANALRKKELVDRVVARTGAKKRDAKPIVEALLSELGEALADGRSLVLPPLGRVRINREKKLTNGRVIVAKIRQNNPPLKAALKPSNDGSGD
ncbi:HU family DNA-binding protein [Roseobacter sp. MH60115]|uniref:HU family DNA-binding protein n=1 Tax=Roseobacter sp. MH60115 TaxID=2785324 RepID=UPI001E48621E|nr:HU family DNA-binding protein [Roseobacter sp. MH60115]